jgi:hypothetical protein
MLNVIMLNVILLNVVMLSVVAPCKGPLTRTKRLAGTKTLAYYDLFWPYKTF